MRRLFGRKRDEPPPDDDEPPQRPRAERPGELPQDGTVTVAGVELTGHQVDGVLWRTDGEPPRMYAVWRTLALAFGETGLWPVLITNERLDLTPDPGWHEVAATDVRAGLAERWAEWSAEDEELAEALGPFPGHAADGGPREPAVEHVFAMAHEADSIALVPVTRPADVLGAIGWMGAVNSKQAAEIVPSLRSWEERYDAILVTLGFDTLELAVRRPPQGEEAYKAAAEIYLVCSDIVDQGVGSIGALAEQMVAGPKWAFWWD